MLEHGKMYSKLTILLEMVKNAPKCNIASLGKWDKL